MHANDLSEVRSPLLRALTAAFLSPLAWLAILQLCIVGGLGAVGYLWEADPQAKLEEVQEAIGGEIDIAARRAALGYSGVTLAITVALSITSAVWAGSTFFGRGTAFPGGPPTRRDEVVLEAVLLILFFFLFVWDQTVRADMQPFPSRLGWMLLQQPLGIGRSVPMLMFALAIIVPAVLAMGAALLLLDVDELPMKGVLVRLRELDHLLYIGALALVFGTLQLSGSLSVGLASFPKTADIKNELEMCKVLATAAPKASANTGEQDVGAALVMTEADRKRCTALPDRLARSGIIDSLRQLVRTVTFSTGLAFSAILVGIYVPSLVRLRIRLEKLQSVQKKKKVELGTLEIDPFRRISALAATMSPFVAALAANAISSV